MQRKLTLILLVSGLVALACPAEASPAVVSEERTFVDASRPTQPVGDFPGAPDRTIRVVLWYPAGGCANPSACPPFPLLLLAHGFGGLPEKFEAFTRDIAAEGFVIAAPAFPSTNANSPGGKILLDVVNQPEDLAFVAGELLLASATPGDPLEALIDGSSLAAFGHSLGGTTVQALAHSSCCMLLDLDAAILASTPEAMIGVFEGDLVLTGPATLVLHGTDDPLIAYAQAALVLATLPLPRFHVGIDGAGHSDAFESQVEPPTPQRAAAETATIAFLNAVLRQEEAALYNALDALEASGHIVSAEGCLTDSDADGACNGLDNCTDVPNGPDIPDAGGNIQLDADLDEFGNACDCDYDGNLTCGFTDFGVMLGCFGKVVGPGAGPADDPECAESDQDGNGTVGFGDFTLFLSGFGEAPGPAA